LIEVGHELSFSHANRESLFSIGSGNMVLCDSYNAVGF